MTDPEGAALKQFDPSIFAIENDLGFIWGFTAVAELYSEALVQIQKYEEDVSVDDVAVEISPAVPSEYGLEVLKPETDEEDPKISHEDYLTAIQHKDGYEIDLISYVVGNQAYVATELGKVYGDDPEQVIFDSWSATWERVRSTLTGNKAFPDVLDFFEQLIGYQYLPDQDTDLDPEQHTAALAFLETLEQYLSLDDMRSSGDGRPKQ